MSDIKNFRIFKHLRSESNMHVRRFRNGRLLASGRGLAFWFMPMGSSIAELPTDDRELQFIFKGRSRDYQEITVQGEIMYRVSDPNVLGDRIDFSVDLDSGVYRNQPLQQLAALFTGTAHKYAARYIAGKDVKPLLAEGFEPVRQSLEKGFASESVFAEMGLQLVSLNIKDMRPAAELEKAMQTPTRESIQQNADEASFQRRALAVEKERAIAENELQNRIELAVREEKLIDQQGINERRRVEEQSIAEQTAVKSRLQTEQMERDAQLNHQRLQAEADSEQRRISSEADSNAQRLDAQTRADSRRVLSAAEAEARRAEGLAEAEAEQAIGLARAAGDRERMAMYKDIPANVVFALALQELAGKLQRIEHINITPDILKTNLADLFGAGAQALQTMGGE